MSTGSESSAGRAGPPTPVDSTSSPASPATPPRRRPVETNTPAELPIRARDPRTRGTLTLSEQAIAKIAAQSAGEVAAAGGRSGGLLGIGAHSDLHARPRVDVELRETSADLFISVSLPWGVSIRQITEQVRERVSRQVEELSGVAVHRVDIDVAQLVWDDPTNHAEALR